MPFPRKSPKDYHDLANSLVIRWIGPEVDNVQIRTGWECQNGHRWMAKYRNLRNAAGNGCVKCANIAHRKTAKDYHDLANSLGIHWIGPEVESTLKPTGWECQNGHRWMAKYNKIRTTAGNGCLKCAQIARRKTAKDYHAVAKKAGITWIGEEEPSSVQQKTSWMCSQKHTWSTTYEIIRTGHGCPICAGVSPKTYSDYLDLAKRRNFEWIGDSIPIRARQKSKWKCSYGHIWKASYTNIARGSGCPYCSGNARKVEKDYHSLAKKRELRWVGEDLPPNTHTATMWECAKGHRWEAIFGSVQSGTGCPICAGVSKIKIDDYYILAELRGYKWLGKKIPQSSMLPTEWECSKGHRWEISFRNIQRGDGCPTCGGTKRKELEDYLELARKRGFTWIGPDLPKRTIDKTTWQCKHGHQWETSYSSIQRGRGCHYCSGSVKKTTTNYQSLAESRNIKWVSGQLPKNAATPTEWECSQGHRWEARFSSIRRGTGCPVCSKVARKTRESYLSLAATRGFEWVGSSLPQDTSKATTWKCKKGHTWSARFQSIQRGTGCPTCSGRIPKKIKDYKLLAKMRGFTWAGNSLPKNSKTPTAWICPDGHKWKTSYHHISLGTGCPICHRLKSRGHSTFRKTTRDYHILAVKRGFEWVGDVEPDNTTIKTYWKCVEGHIWETSCKCIRRGSSCHVCKGTLKKTKLDYARLAANLGIEWIGSEIPKNVDVPTDWECSRGHQWKARYASLSRGSGCPYCAGTAPKIELDYFVLAEQRGFEWIDDKLPKNIATKTTWACEMHHVWEAAYDSIRRGNGCPHCAKCYPKNIQDYIDLAKSRGFSWVGESLPENTKTKTTWECGRRHRFDAKYNDLINGKNCPKCYQMDRHKRAPKLIIRDLDL